MSRRYIWSRAVEMQSLEEKSKVDKKENSEFMFGVLFYKIKKSSNNYYKKIEFLKINILKIKEFIWNINIKMFVFLNFK